MKRVLLEGLALVLAGSLCTAAAQQAAAGGSAKAKKAAKAPAAPSVSSQLKTMSEAIEAQQKQILELQQELQKRDQAVDQLQQRLDQSQAAATQAQTKADSAAATASQQQQSVTQLQGDVTDLKQNASTTALSLQETQKSVTELGSPLAIRFKGVTLTPGGFLAAETVYRQKGLAADVNTPLNAVPFTGAPTSNVSEFNASGRQSRISLLGEGKLKSTKISGYWEADFLSAGTTSNNNQSNSYTLRQRQLWGQAAFENGWSFTGGQMWSLVTETKQGVDNRSEALPMTIDAQYHVGFSWARQYGVRIAKNFSNHVWAALSVENPETTFGGHGLNQNFFLGAPGAAPGLFNPTANYSFNSAPDIIVKGVAQGGPAHFEIFGVLAQFRDRVYPCATATGLCDGVTGPSATGAHNDSRTGGGIGANARFSVFQKHLDLGVHFLGGDGIGRYGSGGLPDATVRPDGTLALIRNYQALGTIEVHKKAFDIYLNGGGEYAARTAYIDPVSLKPLGYGSPLFDVSGCSTETVPGAGGFLPGALGKCNSDTRALLEGTIGFWYKIYNGPKGRVQFGPQYSYIERNTWSGSNGTQPKATDNMVFTSFRYYLP